MTVVSKNPRIIVALDYPSAAPALDLVSGLDPASCRLKVGKEMFTRLGPAFVEKLVGKGFDVFLDLKFHDIPNTVAAACEAAADLGVWMVNVHASGGRRMMMAARERLEPLTHRPLLIAVTVLTSLGEKDIAEVGYSGAPVDNVIRLARLTADSGLDGIVCSPLEAAEVRPLVGQEFLLVTPGVRPASAAQDDQKRVMTPLDALNNGADLLVIGRPITAADDPQASLDSIQREIAGFTSVQ
ncbi:orotidine-5'-phosphate decarboxylase [Sedimenticola selenatireducens]|uniref:orotidine-5'-phosphate decarboxylase n=3 Tax=Sedimenticola selenatireducens TaxID=191960 RepID=UPI00048BA0D9|nr:orotidine-5'-phosphate decarboxylase [Sedimenticola selenatireducens]